MTTRAVLPPLQFRPAVGATYWPTSPFAVSHLD